MIQQSENRILSSTTYYQGHRAHSEQKNNNLELLRSGLFKLPGLFPLPDDQSHPCTNRIAMVP